jgi:hypothetical protein
MVESTLISLAYHSIDTITRVDGVHALCAALRKAATNRALIVMNSVTVRSVTD